MSEVSKSTQARKPAKASISEWIAQGLRHHQRDECAEAEAFYRRVLVEDPTHPDALHLQGLVEARRGNWTGALAYIGRALERRPDEAVFHNNRGLPLERLGRKAEAAQAYRSAIGLKPDYAEAHYNLGRLLREQGDAASAVHCHRRALAAHGAYPEAEAALARALEDLGKDGEAIEAYRRAIALRPGYVDALIDLAGACLRTSRPDEARTHVNAALAAKPLEHDAVQRLAVACNNLGIQLLQQGRPGDGEAALRNALQLDRDHAEARFNLSLIELLEGDYAQGWVDYEARWATRNADNERLRFLRALPVPEMEHPAQAAGRSVLVYAEQGLGDTIQFVRYTALLARSAARVVLDAPPELRELLSGLPGVTLHAGEYRDVPRTDLRCALLSLPRVFGTDAASIPAGVPYLQADPGRVASWCERLAAVVPAGTRLRVGLVWAGNPEHNNDRNRSVPLATLAASLSIEGVCFVSLQKGPGLERDSTALSRLGIASFATQLVDFSETAAAIANLDLVVSVDTAVAHLAGALGKPVWMLLPFAPDWRWGPAGEKSAWYPSMRLLRQPRPGEWSAVVEQLREQLRGELVALAGTPPPLAALLDEAARRKQTIAQGRTDLERWSDPAQLDSAWEARAAAAAEYVPAGATVLDLGCGGMALERFLPAACRYLPSDVVRRDSRTRLCDLNKSEFPDDEQADFVTMLGVLEYVYDVPALLRRLRQRGLPVLLSYCATDFTAHLDRGALGWVNHLSSEALARMLAEAGFTLVRGERIDGLQLLLKLAPAEQAVPRPLRVTVLSYYNVGNFGDRLGVQLVNEMLPAGAVVRHATFKPWNPPAPEDCDLAILGIGNSLFAPLLTDELIAYLGRVPRAIGIFGTQYREAIDPARLAQVLDRLTVWFARSEEDLLRYGRGRSNAVHLGDWLIDAFPLAEPVEEGPLAIGDEIWGELPLDRTIQNIQRYARVLSTRLHPLLCAFTSARQVAYREQREGPAGIVSGKFRSLLVDVFGRSYPEERYFDVDRDAVAAYKARVKQNVRAIRSTLEDF